MAKDFVVIHEEDTSGEAIQISQFLIEAGHPCISYFEVIGNYTQSQVENSWSQFFGYTPAFIFLSSPKFFNNLFLTEMAINSRHEKRAVYVAKKFIAPLPKWFESKCIFLSQKKDRDRGWNQLIESLNEFTVPSFTGTRLIRKN